MNDWANLTPVQQLLAGLVVDTSDREFCPDTYAYTGRARYSGVFATINSRELFCIMDARLKHAEGVKKESA